MSFGSIITTHQSVTPQTTVGSHREAKMSRTRFREASRALLVPVILMLLQGRVRSDEAFLRIKEDILLTAVQKSDKAELDALFARIGSLKTNLSQKASWKERDIDATNQAFKELNEALGSLVERQGIAPAVALLKDTDHDDYVRQAALSSIIKCKALGLQDLPLLCEAFLGTDLTKKTLHSNPRGWLTPEIARMRLSLLIVRLLGISQPPQTGSPIAKSVALEQPRQWLKNVITLALEHTVDQGKKDILTSCLQNL